MGYLQDTPFSLHKNALTLTELSEETGLAKSTTTRIIATLEENSFLNRDPSSNKYVLGVQLYRLGYIASLSMDLKKAAEDNMLRLRERLGETINLYIRDGEYRVCIQQFVSLQSVKHVVHIGQKLPLTVGASGKVLLAYQENDCITEMMKKQKMVKNKAELKEELTCINENQFAISIEEREAGTSAAATSIFDIEKK